eukprot:jgi/Orpsp1_1/1179867/evm.model.c7180000071120.1
MNEKNVDGDYPLLRAVQNNNLEMINLLMDYANRNHIRLNIEDKNKNGVSPIFWAIRHKKFEILKLML